MGSFGSLQEFLAYYRSVYGTSYYADMVLNQQVNQLVVKSAVGPVERSDV